MGELLQEEEGRPSTQCHRDGGRWARCVGKTTILVASGSGNHSAQKRTSPDTGLNPAGQYMLARPATIFGGSSEILRNVLARAELGMPAR